MTPQELRISVFQLAIQGKLVLQEPCDVPFNLSGLNLHKTTEMSEWDQPENWCYANIETVTKSIPTKKYQILESEVLKEGRYIVVSQSKEYSIGFTNDEKKVFRHSAPVVIFGDHTTEIKLIDFDFVVGADGVKIFEPCSQVINPKFLFFVLKYYTINLN